MNQITIMGHLGSDPEVRFTPSGQKVTTLRVAGRGKKDETLWWRITIWGEQFDKIMPYFKKGSAIIVHGMMQKPEIYTNREGQPQTSLNVVAHHITFPPFGRKEEGQSQGSSNQGHSQDSNGGQSMQQGQGNPQQHEEAPAFAEDEIPF